MRRGSNVQPGTVHVKMMTHEVGVMHEAGSAACARRRAHPPPTPAERDDIYYTTLRPPPPPSTPDRTSMEHHT